MIKIRPIPIDLQPQRDNTPFVIAKPIAMPPVVPVSYDTTRIGLNTMQVPITLEIPGENRKFTFPTDPLVSVSRKNIVVRRQVLKSSFRGTVKERWSEDDYNITIAGVFNTDEYSCVEDYITELLILAKADKSIRIICPYLNDTYEILNIAIESVEFPFTQGENSQKFTIKAYSDAFTDNDKSLLIN